MIRKIIFNDGTTLEIGDFYGGGSDEVIRSFEREKSGVKIWTNQGFYNRDLLPGTHLTKEDGTFELIKSKYDVEES